jgi:RNA polymerase sigma-70 factor (ECF subfamily)
LGINFPQTLDAARAGADWAWANIYRDLAPSVLGYIRGRGGQEPEDVMADVFLQVVRDVASFAGGEREFRSWVFAIARHRLVDDWRRRSRRPIQESLDSPPESYLATSAEENALTGMAGDRVHQIIQGLTTDQCDVLLLRILGDLTVEDIAGVVKKSPGAVKALQRRGLEAIRRTILLEGVTL